MNELIELIKTSKHIVFFGGAGVSTESGLKDFRSKDGLYNEYYKYPPETILSHSFFMNNTHEFYKFYKDKLNSLKHKPNITHYVLSELEKENKLDAIITQNIDGFHTLAGSKKVIELHGSIHQNYCMKCNKFYAAKYVFESKGVPLCTCGGIIKPDVVLYEEALDDYTINEAIKYISNADLLIIAGTSLTVYPATNLIKFFKGKNLVIINKDKTNSDNLANIIIHENIGKVFIEIKKII